MRKLFAFATAVISVLFATSSPVQARSIPPAEFIVKVYSEALGRAPDVTAWQNNINIFLSPTPCDLQHLQTVLHTVFSSAEYTNKAYTAQQQTLTAYRAVLSREPDQSGFNYWVGQFGANPQLTADQLANNLSQSAEFGNLIPDICRDDSNYSKSWDYNRSWSHLGAIAIGQTLAQADVQACINSSTAASPCALPQSAIVYLTSSLTVGSTNSLITAGSPAATDYAKQARLVRNSGDLSFTNLIELQSGGQVHSIWLSSQRQLYSLGQDQTVRGNIRVDDIGNTLTTTIDSIRSDSPLQKSHLESWGESSVVNISNSLFTGYTSWHYENPPCSGCAFNPEPWSDGISHHAKAGTIQNNTIIDPTDAGIVIFGTGNAGANPQRTVARFNTIVHAGQSAYTSLAFDTTDVNCVYCSFSGALFDSNTIYSGTMAHSDVMLAVGTGPWPVPIPDCSTGIRCGQGASMTNNQTILGDANQQPYVQLGVVNDGIRSASISGNNLAVRLTGSSADFGCYTGSVAEYHSPDHATGGTPNAAVHSCITHQYDSTPYIP